MADTEKDVGQPVRAPTFSLTGFGIALADANVSLVGLCQVPLQGAEGIVGAAIEPVVVLNMAIPALKDLTVMLNEAIAGYESNFGPVETSFTKERAKK